MRLFYKISEKEHLEIRNTIFCQKGIPALKQNNFMESPFSTTWFGKNNLGDYTYEFCRLSPESNLEMITAHISSGDSWIKVFLNIFTLKPTPSSIVELKGVDGLQFLMPPNSIKNMRLRIDDYKGIPLFNFSKHKLKPFYTSNGLVKKVKSLEKLIETDLQNIDSFIKNWHELYQPNKTDWNGNIIEKSMLS